MLVLAKGGGFVDKSLTNHGNSYAGVADEMLAAMPLPLSLRAVEDSPLIVV